MIAAIIIPLFISLTIGLIGYLSYRFIIFDYLCNRTVNLTLKKYDIKKTQYQIIKEFYEKNHSQISDKIILHLTKKYRQKEPEKFLTMYDFIRDNS
jgi:hypothetical protein